MTSEAVSADRPRTLTTPARWRFCLSTDETWNAVYQDCVHAERSIEMEHYIFNNDEVGQKFMRLFIEKAQAGLQVRILCDEVGSYTFLASTLVQELREAGGVFEFYNSIKFVDIFKPKRYFPRTHLKVIVIDRKIVYMGGVCFAQRMSGWRDTQIRIESEALARQAHLALARNRGEKIRKQDIAHNPESDFYYLQSEPGFFRHPIYRAMLAHIRKANDYIYISEGFFVPTRRLRRHLKYAVKRGVKVIVLVPEHSDFWIADWACLGYAGRLLKYGVRLFRYTPAVLHNKTMLVDGVWGTVGSSNMDALSFFHNREANVVIHDREVLARMKSDFEADLANSEELTRDILKNIPLWKRIAAHLARLGRSFL